MATVSPKPTFVIVPGGWHTPACYDPLLESLEAAGYPTQKTSLPSLNAKEPLTATCQLDADSVRRQLVSIIESEGQDVIVICHSYGGIPGGGAARGLHKTTRTTEGKQGGVLGLVYCPGFVVPEGVSLKDYLGGQHPPYLKHDQPSTGLCLIAPAIPTLYADVDPAAAEALEGSLLPHAIKAFESPAPAPAWAEPAYKGKLAFLKCVKDAALPTFVQDMFVQRSGVEWIVKDIEASHSPFVSKTEEMTKMLVELAGVFAGSA